MTGFLVNKYYAYIECPKCRFRVMANLKAYLDSSKTKDFRFRCKCGHVFKENLERRQHSRETPSMRGTIVLKNEWGTTSETPVKLNNISQSGLNITTVIPKHFNVNDECIVKIQFDDPPKLYMVKEGIVKYISIQNIGIKFKTKNYDWIIYKELM